jgi:hypothetical protein
MGWEGASKDEVRDYILNRMNVNLFPVLACGNSDDEGFCKSGVFMNSEDELEEAVLSSGWVEIEELVENPNSESPEFAFEAMLRHVLDWKVEVSADSQEIAEMLVQENLAKCFQLEELDTAGFMEIEVIQIDGLS